MITYKVISDAPGSAAVGVRLDGRHVGTIVQLAPDKWQYCPANSNHVGNVFPNLRAVQRSLEEQ